MEIPKCLKRAWWWLNNPTVAETLDDNALKKELNYLTYAGLHWSISNEDLQDIAHAAQKIADEMKRRKLTIPDLYYGLCQKAQERPVIR